MGLMWKDSEGNYGPLAYVVLGVLAVAAIVMVVSLASTPAWQNPVDFSKIEPNNRK